MEWFDRLFRRAPKDKHYAPSMDGSMPLFSQFGTNVYAYDVVQQAISCIVDEMKKLNPTHIRMVKNDPQAVNGDIQNVLNDPNPLMTTAEFIEKTTWLLLLNYNAFVVPTYWTWVDAATGATRRRYEALYPLNPTQVDFIEDASGRLFVTFWFYDGSKTTVPYDDVIHLRYRYSVNQYMGGDRMGQPDHKPLLETIRLNDELLKGIAKAMRASYAVTGIVKYNSLIDEDKMTKAVKDLERRLAKGESGILPIDLKASFTPFDRKAALVDEATLKFIDEKILRNWGVPLPILTGDFKQEQYNAFYSKTLEPLVKVFSQAFTKKLFTEREKSFGNRIEFYPEDLVFLSIDQRIKMVELLAPTGGMFENEKRVALGMRPLEELDGQRYMSLNWINANNAAEYQVGKVNVDVVDENKTVTE